MTAAAHAGQITMTFQPISRPNMAQRPVGVLTLTKMLETFQRAVHMTAAHAFGRPAIRNLSESERQHYTLALQGVGLGGLRLEFAPLAAFEREEAPTLFGAEEMHRITSQALVPVFDRLASTVAALAIPFTGEVPADPRLADKLRAYASDLAAQAVRASVEFALSVAPAGKLPTTLHADLPQCARVTMRAAIKKGTVGEFDGCAITDINAETHSFHARIPAWGDERIRCELEPDHRLSLSQDIQVDERITIIGQPRWEGGRSQSEPPTVIRVLLLLDEYNNAIGQPSIHAIARLSEEIAPYG